MKDVQDSFGGKGNNLLLLPPTQRKKKESLVTKPSLLKESLIIPEESLHFIRRSSLIFWYESLIIDQLGARNI